MNDIMWTDGRILDQRGSFVHVSKHSGLRTWADSIKRLQDWLDPSPPLSTYNYHSSCDELSRPSFFIFAHCKQPKTTEALRMRPVHVQDIPCKSHSDNRLENPDQFLQPKPINGTSDRKRWGAYNGVGGMM